MKIPTWGNVYWPIFLIAVSVLFLVPEILALATNAANTLSDYARHELGVPVNSTKPVLHTAAWLLSLGAWLVGVFWLTKHIWFGEYN